MESRIIDTKLPLAWLIGSAAMVIFAMGGIYIKLDTVSVALAKLEAKVDQRDDRIGLLQNTVTQTQGKTETQQNEINRLGQDVSDLKRSINQSESQNRRYAPR